MPDNIFEIEVAWLR